jgi:formate C-acetyltransferase
MTSVGLSTVVNSLLNIEQLVFVQKAFTLNELNDKRKENFENDIELRELLNRGSINFGNDDEHVIELLNGIMKHISGVFDAHRTKLGGHYKYGLSSPNYVIDGSGMPATFDGRKAGDPFGVHISGKNGLAPTELMSFASRLDYNGNRINGNVVDFIVSPVLFKENFEKAFTLIKSGIDLGFYQLQINVVESKTLIEAKANPELFPNLVVRVWGFSAYFNDLPAEYQDNLIKRAIEAEMIV